MHRHTFSSVVKLGQWHYWSMALLPAAERTECLRGFVGQLHGTVTQNQASMPVHTFILP